MIDCNAIIDNFIKNLRDDSHLNDGIPEEIQIYKGVRRMENLSDNFSLFVYRDSIADTMPELGKQQYHTVINLHCVCISRWPYDPEQLEEYTNNFASNILNHIFTNFKKDGENGWNTAIHTGSEAVSIRDANEQVWEMEVVKVALSIFNCT